MNNNDYIRMSLELHLFFDRIMKEHSFFLGASFTEKNNNYKKTAQYFQNSFDNILKEAIILADGNVSSKLISSGEIVTKNTIAAEEKTTELTGVNIDANITRRELALKSGSVEVTEETLSNISNLNKRTLPLIENLIKFKNEILNNVLACKMYTTNYPLLITHIMNEAKMYYTLLSKVENKNNFSQNELYEQELFWNKIMMEHAEFIRGLLDPSEEELILTADQYADEYKEILKTYGNNPTFLGRASLSETIKFRDFKRAGEEGILNCKIKSIIIPLLADHVLREANHFIRILESFNL